MLDFSFLGMLPNQSIVKPVSRSCHHGDVKRPNELEAALTVARQNPEIEVFEIDFVDAGGPHKRLVSSHDYNERAIARGSDLIQWLEQLVIGMNKILWIDVKQNLDLYFAWSYPKFHTRRLFRQLSQFSEKHPEIRQRVWIGCQDCALRASLLAHNEALPLEHRWKFILDMPTVEGYVWQRLIPKWSCCGEPQRNLRQYVYEQFRETDYQNYDRISLDKDFFQGPDKVKEFVRSLKLRPDVLIILNSFSQRQPPIFLEDHTIVMQYDYTCK